MGDTTVLPARAYKPQDKSLVEGAVKLVYQRIFYPLESLQFFSLSSLNAAIKEKLSAYNQTPFQGREYSRKDLFEKQERDQLQPLADRPFEIKYYKRAKVQKNSHVRLGEDSHYYSVPYAFIGKRVGLHYSKTMLEIYCDYERVASHARSKIIGGYTTQKAHMPSTHQYVKGWNAQYFIDWGKSKSELIGRYIERVIKKRTYPEQAYKSCMGLQQLYKQYPRESFEKACHLGYKTYYCNAARLFARLKGAKADGSYIKEINRIERQELLIIDDFGLQPLDNTARQALMEIIEDRHGRKSTLISSQLPVNTWHEIIGESNILSGFFLGCMPG